MAESVTRPARGYSRRICLAVFDIDGAPIEVRRAELRDLAAIVEMLAADQLGRTRESVADLTPYEAALTAIDADAAQLLVVGEDGGAVVATLQLTFIPGLARAGALRAQIEAVRVRESHRSTGLGTALIEWAVAEARERGAALVQLTSDKTRTDALRFYERLGFEASHEGLKRRL